MLNWVVLCVIFQNCSVFFVSELSDGNLGKFSDFPTKFLRLTECGWLGVVCTYSYRNFMNFAVKSHGYQGPTACPPPLWGDNIFSNGSEKMPEFQGV